MFLKSKCSNRRWILILLACAGMLLSACDSKESGVIKIEKEVVSKSGSASDKQAVDEFLKEKAGELQQYSKQMAILMTGVATVDKGHATNEKGVQVPVLLIDGKPQNNDHSIPEKLSAASRGVAVATIFVRSGNEFVRIATSLKRGGAAQEGEERAVGSMLEHNHPAYAAIMGGKTYTGPATLFDNIYMTEYTPIVGKDGSVIGIQFVGMDIAADIILLQRKLGAS